MATTEDLYRLLLGMVKGNSLLNLEIWFDWKNTRLSTGETKNKNEMEIALLENHVKL